MRQGVFFRYEEGCGGVRGGNNVGRLRDVDLQRSPGNVNCAVYWGEKSFVMMGGEIQVDNSSYILGGCARFEWEVVYKKSVGLSSTK